MKYSIQNERIVFDDHYKVVKASVTYETFQNEEITTNRLAFERGDSVAIILFEKESNTILLTNQFRYPTCKHNNGWLLEIPAGSLEEHENPSECIIREVMEELGYKIASPQLLHTFYTSPGAATERIFLFYAEVSQKDKIGKGGGNEGENEDIQTIKIPISDIRKKLPDFIDGKTILALQWFLLNKLNTL